MEGRGAIATWLWETRWVPFNVVWNATGQPAASVPAGFSAGGLPLAVQLVGSPVRRGDPALAQRPARGRPPVRRTGARRSRRRSSTAESPSRFFSDTEVHKPA